MTVLYAVILVAGIFVRPQAGKILLQALLLVCTLSELSISAGIMIQGMDAELQYHDREEYRLFTETYQPAAAYIQAQDPGFYRMENIDRRSSNDGYTLRYNGVSHYSSFSHQGVNLFLAQLGQHASVNDRFYKYYDATAVTDALCGVRYLLGGSRTEPIYRQVQVVNEIPIYQNTLALPVIYPARSEVLEFTPQSESRIENQEAFLQAAFGDGNVYTPAEMTKTAEDKYVFTVQEEGEAYLEARLTRSAGVWIWVNGQSRYLPEFGTYLIHIGYFYPGEEVTISIAMPDGARMADQPQLYSFSAEKFSNLTETARKTEVVQQGDTGLSVSCNTAEDRFYLTSIPADPGWELYLDGEKAGTSVMSRAFLAFSVPAGTEEIQLRYTPPGLRVGAGISIATAVLCLLYGLYTGFRRRYAGRALLDQLDKLDKKK